MFDDDEMSFVIASSLRDFGKNESEILTSNPVHSCDTLNQLLQVVSQKNPVTLSFAVAFCFFLLVFHHFFVIHITDKKEVVNLAHD
jgi:hypothetical protein